MQALFFSSGLTCSISAEGKLFLMHQQGSAELIMQLFAFLHKGQLFSFIELFIFKLKGRIKLTVLSQ